MKFSQVKVGEDKGFPLLVRYLITCYMKSLNISCFLNILRLFFMSI